MANYNKKWGDLVDYFLLIEDILVTCTRFFKKANFKGERSKELKTFLKVYYEAYENLVVAAFSNHHSFTFVKKITDGCWEVFSLDIQDRKQEFLAGKFKDLTLVFQRIIQGYTLAITMLLQKSEVIFLQILLDKLDFRNRQASDESQIMAELEFSMRCIFDQLAKSQEGGLYQTYRGLFQELISRSGSMKKLLATLVSDGPLPLSTIGKSEDRHLLEDLYRFVLVCNLANFSKYLELENKE